MTTLSANGLRNRRAETAPADTAIAKPQDDDRAPRETLDLVGKHPPRPPAAVIRHVVGARVPPAHEQALRRIADHQHVTVSDLIRDMVEREVGMPPDVAEWLLIQRRQVGATSDAETITILVRHLAKRWPFGCRLAD